MSQNQESKYNNLLLVMYISITPPPPPPQKNPHFSFTLLCLVFIADEVIRKRLLIDGDGAGDDRRINVLLKSFLKWCHSNVTPEEG